MDPRGETQEEGSADAGAAKSCRAHITFAINVHDFVNVDESADTVLRLIDLFEKYGVRGDFYLTGPQVWAYLEAHPEVIERLVESGMTISYHVRPPLPPSPDSTVSSGDSPPMRPRGCCGITRPTGWTL